MATSRRLVFVCPRFAQGTTVGGAETLLRHLAVRAAALGDDVSFLTTCATDHFTWANDLPPGRRDIDGMTVHFFPVDEDRDTDAFFKAQRQISSGRPVSRAVQDAWLRNSVNSRALCDHLAKQASSCDRIIIGPYLFGLTYFACRVAPPKTLLVPCLHNEPFAYLSRFKTMFCGVRGVMFNTEPERDLASRIFGMPARGASVVGMAFEPFDADPHAFARQHTLSTPYLIYSGRREAGKGTPLLLDYFAAFRSRTGEEIALVLTGSGDIQAPAECRNNIRDMGFLATREKHEAMAGAIAFCHPSLNESLSIVLLESWVAGTPALVHAASDVLRYQCERSHGGLWFRSYPEFEEALMLLKHEPELRTAMGAAGREYVLSEYNQPAIDAKLRRALDA